MKQRIVSAAIGLVILFSVFAVMNTVLLNAVISAIIFLALHELFAAAKLDRAPAAYPAYLFGVLLPFLPMQWLSIAILLYAFLSLATLLRYHDTLSVKDVGFLFAYGLLVSFSTTGFLYLRDHFGFVRGFYGIIVVLVGAWMSDTGGYFFGMFFGKHKLSPRISPKKTVEGFWGGILVAAVSQLLAAFLYTEYCAYIGITVSISYAALLCLSPILSVVSVLGDLSASIIKRQFGIKDFGSIMPGHGGVLDRFDSVLPLIPLVFQVLTYYPLIRLL